jgi:hypothetical protein
MPFDLTINNSGQSNNKTTDPKKARIEAARAAAAAASSSNSNAALVKYIPASECPDRNRIVFDDSGSMFGSIDDAKKGVVEFLRNCIPNQTAVALHFMNSGQIELQSDLVSLGNTLLERKLISGGTPFFNTLKQALEAKPVLTRLIAFTDGAPTDRLSAENSGELEGFWTGTDLGVDPWKASANIIIKISLAIGGGTKPIPIDTVYFGADDMYTAPNIKLLKYLSEQTGGYFLHFDPSIPNIFKQLKYLTAGNRLMLASESFRAEVESGK